MRLKAAVLLSVLVLLYVPASSGTLLVDQVSPYVPYGYGLGSWDSMTAALQAAFGAGNITVSTDALGSGPSVLGFDALWITTRQPLSSLSAGEVAALQAFIATGRRVALFGEHVSWTTWNNSILGAVGGS